jgi:hypothetical protein
MTNTIKTIAKINGKMTKRETLRQMWQRAVTGESSNRMAISYLARRIDLTIDQTYRFIRCLNRFGMIATYEDKRSIVFFG